MGVLPPPPPSSVSRGNYSSKYSQISSMTWATPLQSRSSCACALCVNSSGNSSSTPRPCGPPTSVSGRSPTSTAQPSSSRAPERVS
ncbi:hypothetical protein B0H17DRAFT_619428 [Mycena rosella]|uniref:Uncharacterized protein n=1 Tax=Mycena rosella TaxID=1033263 RepID=A0AAD7GVN3_MYCRO|nr:hypothetical protein B0H17DRAFT_619428 [Mycena rosella]